MTTTDVKRFIQKGKFRQAKGSIVLPETSSLSFIINPIDTVSSFKTKTNTVLSSKWRKIREDGKAWWANRTGFAPGELITTAVQSNVWVVTVVLFDEKGDLIKDAVEKAFKKIAKLAKDEQASLHADSSLTELDTVSTLADKHFLSEGLNVYLYNV